MKNAEKGGAGGLNPKMDMQKIVTLDGFWVRVDPREHLVKKATLRIKLSMFRFYYIGLVKDYIKNLGWATNC